MTIKKRNKVWLFIIIGLIASYFAWIILWPTDEYIRTTGGNLISLVATLLPVVWITSSFKQGYLKKDKRYWQLLLLGSSSYFLAEVCWAYADTILPGEPTFPGIYDFFYMSSGICYFLAFTWRIVKYAKKAMLVKFMFDILVLLSVSLTFSWYFILGPLIAQTSESLLMTISVALFYLVGDILLILCVATFYFGGEYFFTKKILHFIILALSLQFTSISVYFLETAQETYFSGSWIDPIFILAVLLIGYTALLEREVEAQAFTESSEAELDSTSIIRLILPYALVIILFIFMVNHSTGVDAISIGSGISIILVIFRQIIVIFENRNLVNQYYNKAEELEISEERYRSLFEYHPDSVFSMNLKGDIESVNTGGVSLLGHEKNEIIGASITDFMDVQQLKNTEENFKKINSGWIDSHELSFKDQSGETLWIDMTHIPILVKSKLVGSFGVGRNITENKSNREKVHFYAYHDYLTGLANRRAFEDKLEKMIEYSEKTHDHFAILFLDLDKFKEINDTFGHALGDDLLTAIAERISHFISEDDFAARLGGDEFTILLNNIPVYEVQEIISELSVQLDKPYTIRGRSFSCSASIGFAYYPVDGQTGTELLSKADNAMYRVKRSAMSFKN